MRSPNEFESVRQARRSIGLVRLKLLKPTAESLDGCAPHLRVAIDAVNRLQIDLAKQPGLPALSREKLRSEIDELRIELTQVIALVRNAAGFYAGLSLLLAPPAETVLGYVSGGVIMAQPTPTLQLEG